MIIHAGSGNKSVFRPDMGDEIVAARRFGAVMGYFEDIDIQISVLPDQLFFNDGRNSPVKRILYPLIFKR